MGGIKEIRTRIKSVESTLKITNAMYLISSAGLRKARKQLTDVTPYFRKVVTTIADILHHSPTIRHPYFDQREEIPLEDRKVAFVVITGDKGLAGAYNHNVIKLVEQELPELNNAKLFLIGQMGRAWFSHKTSAVQEGFLFSAQNPTLGRAREISTLLLDLFLKEEIDEVRLVYTKMISPLHLEPTSLKLLPLDREIFPWQPREEEDYPRKVSYLPSEEDVMDHLVPSYFTGVIFGALVESFCSEQSARMMAMDNSTKNAKEMLKNLSLSYNRARQAAITQEINEIVGGAKAGLS